jgi:hypothetical protein
VGADRPSHRQPDTVPDNAPNAVRGAVASLSGALGNNVLHPMDKKRAINAFKALYMCGVPIDHVLVRSLAIKENWQPNASDRLAEIARRVSEGRLVRGGDHLTKTEAKELVARFEGNDQ